ncbi:DNA repair protein RecO [Candidatus Peribacteria bacterium RIFCSPHIGHO2_01_FULL_55_13]|nr:MAG: DNA repair protein RecO [Candidatus Peribacteria bacterium RIFCSPHIGHO2_01_FULL_55_13]OGJ65714.1 MAG: DNA repair protein RecO [Candidatus Peribacteria bacterium RIFCSPHIGHO2_12_FULL_55_11]
MSRLLSCDAIVLATYNVGEADRFCILFTKELGRIAARASAARKPGSRLGSVLLPFQRVEVELREWNSGYIITGARRHPACARTGELAQFLAASEIIELLLMLLEEGEPSPELFECLAEGLRSTAPSPLPHTVRILHLLGHMPSTDMPHFSTFSVEERHCIGEWIAGGYEVSMLSTGAERTLSSLCENILNDHAGKKQRVPGIKQAMTFAV